VDKKALLNSVVKKYVVKMLLVVYNAMKDPHWYAVQESDTRMLPMAASLPGQ